MLISDEKWAEIIAEVTAGIERWNARAAERGKKDRFQSSQQESGGYAIVMTEHNTGGEYGGCQDRKAIARVAATGEVRSAKPVTKRGHVVGFRVKGAAPKAWEKLADKTADMIIERLGLLNFNFGWTVTTDGAPTTL